MGESNPVLTVRPKIADLNFHLYGRSIHPELFDTCVCRYIERENYRIRLNITSDGHLLVFEHDSIVLAEVAASALHPLPSKRQLICCPIESAREEQTSFQDRVHYQCEFQLDIVPPKTFFSIAQQINSSKECEGLIHRFQSSGRMAFGAVSYINIQAFQNHVRLKTFHTFPDSCAIVKSQSEFHLK